MKKYLVPACLLFTVLMASSCQRSYDCNCTTRGTGKSFVRDMTAKNRTDADEKCATFQKDQNMVLYPGIDCSIE